MSNGLPAVRATLEDMDATEAAQWAALHDPARRAQVREELILRYIPLCRYVAFRVAARLVDNVQREDLVSYGIFGLIDAVDRFDPAVGVKFATYATARIQGSILDELRTLDWAPRSVRAKSRALAVAREDLEQRLRHDPTHDQLAAELGWTREQVAAVCTDDRHSYLSSLEPEPGERTVETTRVDLGAEDPQLAAELDSIRMLLAKAIPRLPLRERAVAVMYWTGGACPEPHLTNVCCRCKSTGKVPSLTLGEIAEVLGISESWACQLYTLAAEHLRGDLW